MQTYSRLGRPIMEICLPALLLLLTGAMPLQAADLPADPLGSSRWGDMHRLFFRDAPVVFDDRVRVAGPQFAEDSMNVPISVNVEGLDGVEEVLVFADFNPILKVLEFYPVLARPYLAFRIKLQQSSPVRAAARTTDGVWHVGGILVEASGGGCTAPSMGRGTGDWVRVLNQVSGRVWERGDEGARVRLKIMHPMDTGLAPGIPAFYIERMSLRDEAGREYLRIQTYEPVSENPVFSFDLDPRHPPSGTLTLTGVDNNGNRIAAPIAP